MVEPTPTLDSHILWLTSVGRLSKGGGGSRESIRLSLRNQNDDEEAASEYSARTDGTRPVDKSRCSFRIIKHAFKPKVRA